MTVNRDFPTCFRLGSSKRKAKAVYAAYIPPPPDGADATLFDGVAYK